MLACSIQLWLYQLTYESPLNNLAKWQLHEAPYQCNSQRVLWYDKSNPPARVEQVCRCFTPTSKRSIRGASS